MPSLGAQAREDRMFYQCKDLLRKLFREEYVAMLQEISPSTARAPTTCRCADCLFPESIMHPSSYRVSIEKRVVTDPKYYCAPHEPIAPLSQVLRSGRGPRGLYGLGKDRQEWYCVQCFERLLAIYHQREHRIHPRMTVTTVHPVFELSYYILAEERETAGRSGGLMLCSTKRHGLELWKARCLAALRAANPNYIPMNTPGRADFILYFASSDGKALYLTRDARDHRGRLDDGTVAEIPGDEVDGCTLTELMSKLNMRHFIQPSVPEGQIALERQAQYNPHPYDNPDEEGNEPSHPSRINPKVPVLRISQAVDDRPSRVASDGPAAPQTSQAVDDRPSRVASDGPAASQTSQAVDDEPSRVASDGPAAPQTSQAVDDEPSRVPSNDLATPQTSQAVDVEPPQVASNSLATPKISQAVDENASRVASDGVADPKTITPTSSMPNANDLEAQPLVVLVAGKKTLSSEREYVQEAKNASKTAESSALSLEKKETVDEIVERKDIMTAAEHSSTDPTTNTEALPPSTSGALTPETASVVAAGKSHEKFAKDS